MEIPNRMRATVLTRPGQPLEIAELSVPRPRPGQVLVRVHACGICRTDLHILDGELTQPKLPLVLGHEIVGTVVRTGDPTSSFVAGQRVGVPWLGWTCGKCRYCRASKENLCDNALFTGYTLDGGYAEYAVADERYCFSLPHCFGDAEAAPLLCAGLIGYRSYRLAGQNIQRLGIYGFGAAAHIITQLATFQGKQVYAFTRVGDLESQSFARRLGAAWAGDSTQMPPELLDASLIFAPVGALVPAALRATAKGGAVICGGIHMSDLPSFPYHLLWEERQIRSVANLTRRDGEELLALAAEAPLKISTQLFPMEQANEALNRLRNGQIEGAAVLVIP